MSTITSERPTTDGSPAEWLEIVRKNVGQLRFGSVQITVHDGRVTQVESIEKTRFVSPREEAASLNSK
jgi:hypothetical protein